MAQESVMDKKNNVLVVNGDGTVTDTSTGLVWQQETTGPMTWKEALSYCKSLSLGGHDDWRMPGIKELISIIDYGRRNPAIDTTAFPDTLSSHYWSATTYTDYASSAWCVNFKHGGVYDLYESYTYYVRAVRGGQSGVLDN